jgi:hypothetical protein
MAQAGQKPKSPVNAKPMAEPATTQLHGAGCVKP